MDEKYLMHDKYGRNIPFPADRRVKLIPYNAYTPKNVHRMYVFEYSDCQPWFDFGFKFKCLKLTQAIRVSPLFNFKLRKLL